VARLVGALRGQIAEGRVLDILEVELKVRSAALADAACVLFALLNEMAEPRPHCPVCEGAMYRQGERTKEAVSTLGAGTLTRGYWECPACSTHAMPKDELLHIENTSYTPGTRRIAARLASLESFGEASLDAWDLCGIRMSAKEMERIAEAVGGGIKKIEQEKTDGAFADGAGEAAASGEAVARMYIECDGTGIPMTVRECAGRAGKQEDGTSRTREAKLGCVFTQSGIDDEGRPVRDEGSTTYFGAIECAEDFGKRMYANALSRGSSHARQLVIIGDGARWIWNQAETHFPGSTQIVDLFHAKEHIFSLIRTLISDYTVRASVKKECYALLEAGSIAGLIERFRSLPVAGAEQQKALDAECGYFIENTGRMQYAEFKRMGMFVGSGVIEAGCKNVIGKRLKQSGMHWSVRGANAIIALRCSIMSGTFDEDFDALLVA
jgi:hypothetical protein